MQTEVVQLALDLLVREPDIEGFFGALTKTMVEESESHACGVWLIDEERQRCELWMAYVKDRLFTPRDERRLGPPTGSRFPCESMAATSSTTRRAGRRPSNTAATIRACPSRSESSAARTASARDRRHAARPRRPHARLDDGVQPAASERREPMVARRAASRRSRARRRWRCTTAGWSSAAGSKSAARRSSRSATGSRATFTTTSRRASPRS